MGSRLKLLTEIKVLFCFLLFIVAQTQVVFAKIDLPRGEKSISFKSQKIKVGSKIISVEVAETPEQHERGLMYRDTMPEDHGMIFIFNQPQVLNFWMKNTYIDLSIAYINSARKIIDIQEMKAVSSIQTLQIPTYPSRGEAQYALEMNAKWFAKNNIKVGDTIQLKLSK